MRRLWRDNSLSIVMFSLFALFLLGQIVSGYQVKLDDLRTHGAGSIDLASYLLTGHFIEATFENWESEFLQMGALVILSVGLYQRGSPESKDPEADEEVDREPDRSRPGAPWPVKVGGGLQRVYENSLGLALLGLFALSLVLHAVGGVDEYNIQQLAHGGTGVTAVQFMGTADFWFQSMQNWQSEFLSVGALVVLTVFLRQRGSPDSKPVDESHGSTGEA